MKYKLVDNGKRNQTIIKVVGVGGCGGNAIDHMVTNGVDGVETISANTDSGRETIQIRAMVQADPVRQQQRDGAAAARLQN